MQTLKDITKLFVPGLSCDSCTFVRASCTLSCTSCKSGARAARAARLDVAKCSALAARVQVIIDSYGQLACLPGVWPRPLRQ